MPRTFETCPPVADGVCAAQKGLACAMAATCCVNAPVPIVQKMAAEALGRGKGTSHKGATAAAVRWGRDRKVA